MTRILPVIIFSISFSSTFSQKIHYRLKAGYNYSSVVINGNRPFKMRLGPNGGMTLEVPLKNILCQTGLVYSHKGDSYLQYYGLYPSTTAYEKSTNLHYLEMPVLAGYSLMNKLHLFLGPQLGYLLSGRDKTKGIESESPGYYRKIDFSAIAECEFKIFKNFGLCGGYDYGLSKFIKATTNNGTTGGYKNYGSTRTFFVSIFYEGEVLTKSK